MEKHQNQVVRVGLTIESESRERTTKEIESKTDTPNSLKANSYVQRCGSRSNSKGNKVAQEGGVRNLGRPSDISLCIWLALK